MKLEVCIDSFEGALLAKRYGADRIELCAGLSVGGLTPGIGLTAKCAEIIDVHAMLRHREGGFIYNEDDIMIMLDEIDFLAGAGASGVVFGCLLDTNEIDLKAAKALLEETQRLNLEATFHRAFDFTDDPLKSLDTLIELGFDRLLTSGKKAKAIDGIELIKELTSHANGRIQIMAGSGVNVSNALELSKSGVDALHFSSHLVNKEKDELRMGKRTFPDEDKISSIFKLFR